MEIDESRPGEAKELEIRVENEEEKVKDTKKSPSEHDATIDVEVIDNANMEREIDGAKESQTNELPDKNTVESANNKDKSWEAPQRSASKGEEKVMFAEVLSILTKVIMNNHPYTLGGNLRVQEGNGSIGDRATGIIAQMVMVSWDRKFKNKLKELKIIFDLIKRFIDDINGIFSVIEPGI